MKLRPFLFTLLFFLLVLSTAHAADPTFPADPAFLAPYLPGYTLVHGVDEGDTLYLLMQNPSGATVFVGGTRTDENECAIVFIINPLYTYMPFFISCIISLSSSLVPVNPSDILNVEHFKNPAKLETVPDTLDGAPHNISA